MRLGVALGLLLGAAEALADASAPTGRPGPPPLPTEPCTRALEEARRALAPIEPRLRDAKVSKELGSGHISFVRPEPGLHVVWNQYELRVEDAERRAVLAVVVGLPFPSEYDAPLTWGLRLPSWAPERPPLCDGAARDRAAASVCVAGVAPEVQRAFEARIKQAVAACFATVGGGPRPLRWERLSDEVIATARGAR